MDLTEAMVKAGMGLAEDVNAKALVLITETSETLDLVLKHNKSGIPIIAVTPRESTYQDLLKYKDKNKIRIIKLPVRGASGLSLIDDVVADAYNRKFLNENDLVVAIGSTLLKEADSLMIYRVQKELLDQSIYNYLKEIGVEKKVFDTVLSIALELGREGRDGRLIGTAFLIGDSDRIMKNSKQLILNPFEGQNREERIITNQELRESIKELAQLDGVFVISGDGVIKAAGRYLTANTKAEGIPRGLGARHAAVGATTANTDSLGITVSQSGGIVRIFKKGKIIMTIEPRRRLILREELKKR